MSERRKTISQVATDDHGQPVKIFRANLENAAYKAVDQLSGICAGILADGAVNESEARFFAEWVQKYSAFEPVWPFTDILSRVERIFADGHCDEEERNELKAVMEAICGYGHASSANETYSSAVPLDSPLPPSIEFADRVFNITGRFAYGSRKKVIEVIANRGGLATDSPPTKQSHYVVIGFFASRDWHSANYGRKIERAVELRQSGSGLSIVSEEHWKSFLV